jgi:hypothetical protein
MKDALFRERIGLPLDPPEAGHRDVLYHGFDREELIDLCIRINSVERGATFTNWPPCLGLYKSVVATLAYMRHNRTQSEIGESIGVSEPTVGCAISAITPLITEALREFVPNRQPRPGRPVHPGRYAASLLFMGWTR